MTLEQDIRRLSAIPLLGSLEPEALRLIAFSAETRMFRAGDILFRKGETADAGFLVLSGSVALDVSGEGRPAGQIAAPGALIGERALISALQRPATGMAREPTTVLKITRRLFTRVLNEFPGSAQAIRLKLAEDLAARLADL